MSIIKVERFRVGNIPIYSDEDCYLDYNNLSDELKLKIKEIVEPYLKKIYKKNDSHKTDDN